MRQLNKKYKHLQNKIIVGEELLPSPQDQDTVAKPKIKKLLLLLLSPIFLGIATFIIGMIIMATGSASSNSFIMLAAQLALILATLAYIYAPAYILSLIMYILIVKKFNIEKYKALWIIPCIQTLFTWYPSYIKVAVENRTIAAFLGLTFSALLMSLIWIGTINGYHKFKLKKYKH
jgi:hypothetical protein